LLPFAGGSLPEIRQSGSRSQNEAASSSVKVRATRGKLAIPAAVCVPHTADRDQAGHLSCV